jgi:hypothetical protein
VAVADFALNAWDAFDAWVPAGYAFALFQEDMGKSATALPSSVIRWIDAHPDAPLAEIMIVASIGCHGVETRRDEHPIQARATRGLRVALARRLRDRGLTTWQAVLHAAMSWTIEDVARHAAAVSAACTEMFFLTGDAAEASMRAEAKLDPLAASRSADRSTPPEPAVAEDAHEALPPAHDLTELHARMDTLRQQVLTARRERDELAHRVSRIDSRAESLQEELEQACRQIDDLELQLLMLRRERDELAEQIDVDEAFSARSPAELPPLLQGRDVVLFTGQAQADVRQAMEQSFYDAGARAVTSYWTEKVRGPARVPPDTLVVVDITFMSHGDADAARAMAERSGVTPFLCRRGSSSLAREVVTRLASRERMRSAAIEPGVEATAGTVRR